LVREGGKQSAFSYSTKEEAEDVKDALQRKFAAEENRVAIEGVLAEYEKMMERAGNKAGSIKTTMYRLKDLLHDAHTMDELTSRRVQSMYKALAERRAVDTHRNTLSQSRSFFRWCVEHGYLRRDPSVKVKPVGRRKHGKAQLRIDEARLWIAKARELADAGEAGAVAALMTLLMGLRASEIVNRVVRDLDDEGKLMWIPDAKTAKGRRTVQVPQELQPYLLGLAENNEPEELLFGKHWRDWPREWVQRICKLAEVPVVTAHGMRGLHSTLAVDAGVSSHAVANALGHESFKTTAQSYAKPEAITCAKQRRVLKVLAGGRR
jgi:integrase